MVDLTSRKHAVSYLHSHGFALPAASDEAERWCLLRAEQGDLTAQCVAVALFAFGVTGKRDQRRAFQWAQAAAANGSNDAKRVVATYLISGAAGVRNPSAGVELLQELTRVEHLPSMETMGLLVLTGHGDAVPQNEEAALQLLAAPAQAGFPVSQALLGAQLVAKANPSLRVAGVKWLALAAEAGVASAHRYMARFLRAGEHGLPVDHERAATHEAAAQEIERSEQDDQH